MVIAGRVIQGAAGATILACGLSLLSVANKGDAQLRAVSLWGAAAAVGAAAGPLVGGVLVDLTGWQGLFWIDAGVAVLCMVLTAAAVTESRDPDRPRSIDYAGTVLMALTLTPLILGRQRGRRLGLGLAGDPRLLRRLDRRRASPSSPSSAGSTVPLLDLELLRNRVLVGSTIAILIGAGTINGLMYLLSLYFQDPATLDFSPLRGRAGDPAGDGRARGRGAARAAAGGEVGGRSRRRRVRHHHGRLRRRGLRRRGWDTARSCCRWSPSPWAWACRTGRRRLRRPLRPGEPGRPSVRGLEHGQVRRRRGGDRRGRHLYGTVTGNQSADGASQADALGLRPRRGLVDDGGLQLPGRRDGLGDRAAPRRQGTSTTRPLPRRRAPTRCRPRRPGAGDPRTTRGPHAVEPRPAGQGLDTTGVSNGT